MVTAFFWLMFMYSGLVDTPSRRFIGECEKLTDDLVAAVRNSDLKIFQPAESASRTPHNERPRN